MRRLIFVSLDEVHRQQVSEWAERHDTQVDHVDLHELPRFASADAILCDWDGWTRADRRRILACLNQTSSKTTIVVKGYLVAPDEAELLDYIGAAVQPSWDPANFDALTQALAGEDASHMVESGDALFHDGAKSEDKGEFLYQALDKSQAAQEITSSCLTKSS